MLDLTPEKALVFRITHIENVPWVLENGLHCCNGKCRDPNFRVIGNPDLIDKRTSRSVTRPPGGSLSDYIPFYFTPHSPMLYNIKTGWNGMKKTPMPDIAILVTSLHRVRLAESAYVFTDRHAYVAAAQFFEDLDDLDKIDWSLLRSRNFSRSTDDPGRCERYQAEALIYRTLPAAAILGIACYGPTQERRLQDEVTRRGLTTNVVKRPGWYF